MKKILLTLMLLSSSFPLFASNIKIFCQDGCPPCEQAISYLNSKGLKYQELNIANPSALAEFNRLGGTGTPLIIINGKRIDGFSKEAIDRALQMNFADRKMGRDRKKA